MKTSKYSRQQVSYHWISALLIVLLAITGIRYGFEIGEDPEITSHQILGQIFILVLGFRVATRLFTRKGPDRTDHPFWEKRLAETVHWALYAVLVVYLVTGYVSASALRDSALVFPLNIAFARSDTGEFLTEIHYLLKWVLLALLAMHISSALKHAIYDRDATLSQMWFSKKGK